MKDKKGERKINSVRQYTYLRLLEYWTKGQTLHLFSNQVRNREAKDLIDYILIS